jgi:hypothetical protein
MNVVCIQETTNFNIRKLWHNIGCPIRYRTRHFFNNSNTNEDIVTKFEQGTSLCEK